MWWNMIIVDIGLLNIRIVPTIPTIIERCSNNKRIVNDIRSEWKNLSSS